MDPTMKTLNYNIVQRVFVDLDNTLLPFDTLWPVWKAILAAGLRPNLTKVTLHLGFQSIAKSIMASCFSDLNRKNPQLIIDDAFNYQSLQYMVIIYDLSEQKVYINGEQRARCDVLKGDFSNWDPS